MSKHQSQGLPAEGYVRAKILAPMLGIAEVTLWRWAADGKIPKPIKLGARVTAWRAEDVRRWMDAQGQAA
ncbi:MAG: helix-turn-helix transcriptional regulator [Aeromonas veronii]|jgi:prophage regulatory protein|uniref:helix-turn-helix transcriptional regulator n=1 Tax=Aeromonas TaxID=642 RepID=UPI001CD80E5B|nr:AlpA family phage regulatory protein [Aeromonas veronii]UBR45847.1 AlpA family phage regulatory protein [Aeromonas veronii]